MKKLLPFLLLLALCFSAFPASADELPPQLPSSFYGTVSGVPAGTRVTALVGSYVAAQTETFLYEGQVMYRMDVGGEWAEGTKIVFCIQYRIVGVGYYHTGTNTHLDLHYTGYLKPYGKR